MHKFYFGFFPVLFCCLGLSQLEAQAVSANYFQGDELVAINQGGSAGSVSTFTLDTECEEVKIEITDPVGEPQGTGKPYLVRVRDADGNQVSDFTDRLTVTMRVRSAGAVPVQVLFRSGDGTADFRTDPLSFDVPAELGQWTEETLTFSMAEFGPSFDPSDIRDMWFYLDRSNDNFEGNEFYIDHIVIGGPADPTQNSPCSLDGGGGMETDTMFSANYFQGDTLIEISQGGSAAAATTFTYDTDCEQLKIEVTDTLNAPLPGGNAYVVRVRDADGNQVTNLTDRLTVTFRARSAGAVPVQVLFRSGDGSADFRTSTLSFDVPAGLGGWSESTVTFGPEQFGPSFDPADIRDFWFYLDRGNDNFAGNEFYVDHIVIGGPADITQYSPCPLDGGGGMGTDTMFSANYFQGDTLIEISQSGDAAAATTFTYDTLCEQLKIEVTDPVGAPQGTSKPSNLRLRDADGNQVTDLTDRLTVTMRVRSAEALPVEVLFRSGDGSSDFRTNRLSFDVPAGLEEWTEATLTFTADDFGPSFDPADIRDMWFYLDRSNENFPGNEFYIDHIVVGGPADEEQNSPCTLTTGVAGTFVDYFQGEELTSFSRTNAAGRVATFTLDTECETLVLSVTDPIGDPLPPFNAFQVNPTNATGDRITDLTGNTSVTMRVRSVEAINLSVLLRAGEGTMEERTDRLDVDIPAGLEEWTEFTLTFTEADYAGFDPANFLDMWFYLDRGTPNFAGNSLIIDHIAIGAAPDAAQNSPCATGSVPSEFVVQFDAPADVSTLAGAESSRLTLSITECEEISVAVTDPVGAPFGAFRPIVISPTNANGVSIGNIEGLTDVYIRARSAEEVPLSILFRSGDGSAAFRTATLTETVQGDLTGWSNLKFTFTEADLVGFDPTDLVDMWLYLDRDNDNFPGNELYIDYISIGSKPADEDASPCGLPDLMVSTTEAAWASGMQVFPNPTTGRLRVDIPALAGEQVVARLLDVNGRIAPVAISANGLGGLEMDLVGLPSGFYFLSVRDAGGAGVMRRVVLR